MQRDTVAAQAQLLQLDVCCSYETLPTIYWRDLKSLRGLRGVKYGNKSVPVSLPAPPIAPESA